MNTLLYLILRVDHWFSHDNHVLQHQNVTIAATESGHDLQSSPPGHSQEQPASSGKAMKSEKEFGTNIFEVNFGILDTSEDVISGASAAVAATSFQSSKEKGRNLLLLERGVGVLAMKSPRRCPERRGGTVLNPSASVTHMTATRRGASSMDFSGARGAGF